MFRSFVYFLYILHALVLVCGKEQVLWRVYDEVLPLSLLEALEAEILAVYRYRERLETHEFGKRTTFWFENSKPPRTTIEVAIKLLSAYMKEGGEEVMSHLARRKRAIGAEWWVQVVDGEGGNIGFHYDKDEGMASIQRNMLHPLLSTVTYISSIGSPTVLLNQTTPHGNENYPLIANSGLFVYPRRNRHLMFRGDLNHGVVGSLDVPEECSDEALEERPRAYRITLAINWWDRSPMVPNTMTLTDALAKKMGIWRSENEHIRLDLPIVPSTELTGAHEVVAVPLDMPENLEDRKRHEVVFPPGELFYFTTPRVMERSVYSVSWPHWAVWGGVNMLDLNDQAQMHDLFSSMNPKAILLYRPLEGSEEFDTLLDATLPVVSRFGSTFKFYLCPYDNSCADVADEFGFYKEDLMRLVVHVTQTDAKFASDQMTLDSIDSNIMGNFLDRILNGHEPLRHVIIA